MGGIARDLAERNLGGVILFDQEMADRTLPTRNRAGQAFRPAATSVSQSATAFGAFYWRKRAKGGPLYAQVAPANKIARAVYHMLKYHVQYADSGADEFERRHRERDIAALRKKAARLGFTPINPEAAAA